MNDFDDVEIYTGSKEQTKMPTIASSKSALISSEQARSIAEVQAALIVARMNPRDENAAYVKIMEECRRPAFAQGTSAMYKFSRGGTKIQDINIRVAEMMARCWGNINYGMRELSRQPGMSEVEAFAWDLESNVRVTRQFQVRHIRDRSEGPNVELTQERDIYELMANMGQRRVRACILECIPSYIKDKAKETILITQTGGAKVSFDDWMKALLDKFNQNGVSKTLIDARLGHDSGQCTREEGADLKAILDQIVAGKAKREDFFQFQAPQSEEKKPERHRRTKAEIEATKPTFEELQQSPTVTCPKSKESVLMTFCDSGECPDRHGCPEMGE